MKIKRALISVSEKTGLVEFARELAAMGVEILSTGGTASLLKKEGIPSTEVSAFTGSPEILDGRVKTLHPKIHGGLLFLRGNEDHEKQARENGILPIDLVVVNLYPFEQTVAKADVTLEEAIENIDIGGPSMLRSAAKNYRSVTVVVDPADYADVLENIRANDGGTTLKLRERLAIKVFVTTSNYDSAIANFFNREQETTCSFSVTMPIAARLRYGENPHQQAALYGRPGAGIAGGEKLHGKELSYNNLVDLDAAYQLAVEFSAPAVAIVKHTNPCGCAEQDSLAAAYRKALECDPVSAYGGVIGVNRAVDEETAREIAKLFVEAIAAPDYSPEALAILTARKNLRLMRVHAGDDRLVVKSISGGYLAQTADRATLERSQAVVKSQRQPSEEEWKALEFGWKVAKHVKSNAIVYARAGQVVGVGAGQMSRVDSARFGAMKAILPLAGTAVASDAFFPFADGVEEAAKHGATAFIEPGGSMRDADVIAAADRLGVAMVFTGVRHFRH